MDSLLANYASSDDERDEEPHHDTFEPTSSETSTNPSIFPQPKSSSVFFALPPPKSHPPNPKSSRISSNFVLKNQEDEEGGRNMVHEDASIPTSRFARQSTANPSSVAKNPTLFFSLPEPKSSSVFSSVPPSKSNSQTLPNPSPSNPNPKRVVQFKPPLNPSLVKASVVGDDDEDEVRKPTEAFGSSVQTPSVKSFLSSIPAPKNSSALGALPSSCSGRRSIVDADVPALNSNALKAENEVGIDSNVVNHDSHWVDDGSSSVSLGVVSAPSETVMNGGDFSSGVSVSENFGSYEGYVNYGQYESNWIDRSSAPDVSGIIDSAITLPRKRGRNEVPTEIVEVKQDELIKNRPREDQVKLTGIAFGPSYQPVSTKGKPSKLHKRKHQIGSLFYDMKQKETELAERRSKGFLTKAETQAKYGW